METRAINRAKYALSSVLIKIKIMLRNLVKNSPVKWAYSFANPVSIDYEMKTFRNVFSFQQTWLHLYHTLFHETQAQPNLFLTRSQNGVSHH